jgi:hypothetical protein
LPANSVVPAARHVLGLLRQLVLRRHAFVQGVQHLVGGLLGQGGDIFQAVLGVVDLGRSFGQRLVVAEFAQRVVQQAHDAAEAFVHVLVAFGARRRWRWPARRPRKRGGHGAAQPRRHGAAARRDLVEQGLEVVFVGNGSGRCGRRGRRDRRAGRRAGALGCHFLE